ncbi:MAG: hypothetical protein QNI99_17770 [Woeseiaceae bacterium]|nr:hypothetical protein [Woeseiaceae bacterium]
MTWFIEMPSVGRWFLALGISAVFLLLASAYRRLYAMTSLSTVHRALNATGHMIAYSVLTLIWMWTLEPVQIEPVRVLMSLALALGLGSLLYLQPTAGEHRRVTVANSAGMALGVLTVVALISY